MKNCRRKTARRKCGEKMAMIDGERNKVGGALRKKQEEIERAHRRARQGNGACIRRFHHATSRPLCAEFHFLCPQPIHVLSSRDVPRQGSDLEMCGPTEGRRVLCKEFLNLFFGCAFCVEETSATHIVNSAPEPNEVCGRTWHWMRRRRESNRRALFTSSFVLRLAS